MKIGRTENCNDYHYITFSPPHTCDRATRGRAKWREGEVAAVDDSIIIANSPLAFALCNAVSEKLDCL